MVGSIVLVMLGLEELVGCIGEMQTGGGRLLNAALWSE